MKTKEVKITYHELIKRFSENGEMQEEPYKEVPALLDYIVNLPIKRRFFDLKDDKFCYINEIKVKVKNSRICGVMESARSSFRPMLINKKDGQKRDNPRGLNEGDIERTHFMIAVYPNEVRLFLEFNYSGVRVNNFVNYLKYFLKEYLKKERKTDYSIDHFEIAPSSYSSQLQSAVKASGIEVYLDKKILGSDALSFSNRTVAVKRDVVLSISSKRNEDIKTLVWDILAAFKDKEKNISRVRVRAKNPDNHDVIIDTQAMCEKSVFRIELNEDTGELNSQQVFQELTRIAESFA